MITINIEPEGNKTRIKIATVSGKNHDRRQFLRLAAPRLHAR